MAGYRKLRGHNYVHFIRSTNDFIQFSENKLFSFNEDQQYEGEIFVALEDTIAIRISNENLEWLKSQFPAFKRLMIAYDQRNELVSRELDELCITLCDERYKRLQRVNSFNLSRVPDDYLASYLSLPVSDLIWGRE